MVRRPNRAACNELIGVLLTEDSHSTRGGLPGAVTSGAKSSHTLGLLEHTGCLFSQKFTTHPQSEQSRHLHKTGGSRCKCSPYRHC